MSSSITQLEVLDFTSYGEISFIKLTEAEWEAYPHYDKSDAFKVVAHGEDGSQFDLYINPTTNLKAVEEIYFYATNQILSATCQGERGVACMMAEQCAEVLDATVRLGAVEKYNTKLNKIKRQAAYEYSKKGMARAEKARARAAERRAAACVREAAEEALNELE